MPGETVGRICWSDMWLPSTSQAGNADHEPHSVAASRKRSLPDVSSADEEGEVNSVNVQEDMEVEGGVAASEHNACLRARL